MNTQKISQYFFIIASVIAILDGAFILDDSMTALKIIFLLVSGVIVGILRHDSLEKEFIIAGIAVIFTGLIFTQLLGTYSILENVARMINNFIVFLSTAVIVVGLEMIAEILTHSSEDKPVVKKHVNDLSEEEIKKITFQRIWGTVILVAVALTFILLLAESFFDVSEFSQLIMILDGAITVLFIVDLVILYNDSKSFTYFLKHHIFDIIASIPTVGILRGLKLVRAVRIIKVMKGTTKLSKLTKLYKTSKFFSEESYFNKVNDGSLEFDKLEKKKVVKKKVSSKISKKSSSSKPKPKSKSKK